MIDFGCHLRTEINIKDRESVGYVVRIGVEFINSREDNVLILTTAGL